MAQLSDHDIKEIQALGLNPDDVAQLADTGLPTYDARRLAHACIRSGTLDPTLWTATLTIFRTLTGRPVIELSDAALGYDPDGGAQLLTRNIDPNVIGHLLILDSTDGILKCLDAGITPTDLAAITNGTLHLILAILAELARDYGMPSELAPIIGTSTRISYDGITSLVTNGYTWDDITWLLDHNVSLMGLGQLLNPATITQLGTPLADLDPTSRRLAILIGVHDRESIFASASAAIAAADRPWTPELITLLTDTSTHGVQAYQHVITARALANNNAAANTSTSAAAQPNSTDPIDSDPISAYQHKRLTQRGIPTSHQEAISQLLAAHGRDKLKGTDTTLLSDLYQDGTAPLEITLLALEAHWATNGRGTPTTATSSLLLWAASTAGQPWAHTALEATIDAATTDPHMPGIIALGRTSVREALNHRYQAIHDDLTPGERRAISLGRNARRGSLEHGTAH